MHSSLPERSGLNLIIDRYMVREVGLPFLAVAAVLFIVFSTYSLTRYLVDASAGLLLAGEVLQLTMLRALISMEVLLPLSLYLAVIIGMGRLYSDSEVYSMRSNGISERRMMRPVIFMALTLAILTGVLSVIVRPWAYSVSYQIRAEASATSEADRIKPARFYRFDDAGRTVFIEQIDPAGQNLAGIFVQTRKGNDLQVITAATGKLEYGARPGFHRLKLDSAQVFKQVDDAPDFFADLGSFALWLPHPEPAPVGYKTKAESTRNLAGAAAGPDRAEFQWRFTAAGSALLLILVAIPLSRGRPRQGRYARMLLALVIYAIYFNLLDVSRTWVEQGTIRYLFWVPGALLLVALGLNLPWNKLRARLRAASGNER